MCVVKLVRIARHAKPIKIKSVPDWKHIWSNWRIWKLTKSFEEYVLCLELLVSKILKIVLMTNHIVQKAMIIFPVNLSTHLRLLTSWTPTETGIYGPVTTRIFYLRCGWFCQSSHSFTAPSFPHRNNSSVVELPASNKISINYLETHCSLHLSYVPAEEHSWARVRFRQALRLFES